ncbi:putative ABC transport system ATP-binding protein [Angulomicrobium tetraedrale]|uniref:Putative ABC transport system ATP-binding protein n=1 Tax=Ancylobacter tetraedralis TaxID=217068 RepID=A0A839Z8W1_9HYPH|nr:ABC transporter ATP-binding protein [Ancylobacter tetraedralis]MBB3771316.1 putative ABC transport system ATP-binding protein [Ancylobacter tetraedralis]
MPPDTTRSGTTRFLRLRAVEQRFPGLDTPALAIPSLDIAAGEQVAVMGPSGSGKTTLINLLTGLERVGQGSLIWGDTDLATLSEGARDRWRAANVGLVMQDFHLFPGLSALENVLLPQRLARLALPAGARAEAGRLLARVGIERPGQAIETMSRGQMQRVAVARALAVRPAIIVADEPTASLDADSGAAVAQLLLELAGESGATLLVATHDASLVARLPRVLRLESGRLKD